MYAGGLRSKGYRRRHGCSDRRRSRKYCIEGYGCGQVCDTGRVQGAEVSVDTVEVDEDEWDSLVNNVYYENITAENGGIMDRAVETGDTVNIDYEGKKDGVAFDGGTAQGYDLTIGSGKFYRRI